MNAAAILNDKGRDVVTVPAGLTIRETARVLDERRIGAVVIVDERGGIVGIVSERDVTREFARNGADAINKPVAACMTRDVVTVGPDAAIDDLLSKMTDRRIRHLPIVDRGELIGLVSIGDVVKWKIVQAETEAASLRGYIQG